MLKRLWRLRFWAAGGLTGSVLVVLLLNFGFDALVTRYDVRAPHDPDSAYLRGMTPRELGPADATRAVLFVHGFIGAQSNFNDLPDRVAAAGWFVRTMCLPGHGTSPREFEKTSAAALESAVVEEIRKLKERYPRVVVVGHSMGGALATLAVAREPVHGLVLCAPYYALTYSHILGIPTASLARPLSYVLRWIPARPGYGPVNKKENRKYIDCYHWIPVQGCITALEIGRRANSAAKCARITAPLLLIHSRKDRVTSPDASAALFPAFGSQKKEFIWLETSDHVIFWDYEEAIVTEAVLRFIQEVEHHDLD